MRTIKSRHNFIKDIIKRRNVTETEKEILSEFYCKYFTPNKHKNKINKDQIRDFSVELFKPYNKASTYWKKTFCIYIHWSYDGVTFYKTSLSGRFLAGAKRSQKHDLNGVFRLTIMSQIAEWRMCHNNIAGMHVDHIYPFSCLLKEFLELYKYDEEYLQTIKIRDGHFSDDVLEILWIEYHRKHATFQYLTPEDNMRKGANLEITKNINNGKSLDYEKSLEKERRERRERREEKANWTTSL